MFQFVFANLLMVSLGAILFLFARTIPRWEDEQVPEKQSLIERWVTSEIPHRVDKVINVYAEKMVRKLKVLLLRLDNYLTDRLKKINTSESLTGEKHEKIDIGDIIKTDDYEGPDRRESGGK